MNNYKENKAIDINNQEICLSVNEKAWNQEAYEAWVKRFGTPFEAAEKLAKEPKKPLLMLYDEFGDVKDKKIMNLMGSNGYKAVALAMLGAEVSIVDFSEGNKRYALELAEAAGVKINYILSDVLKLENQELQGSYDIVFAEMGIIHYFSDLSPFINVIYKLLKPKGLFVLRDFHPVSTKLISSRGSTAKVRKHKVTGDYFDTTLEEKEVAYSKYLKDGEEIKKVLLRKWNMGEIVTAVAERFYIKSLKEEENQSCEVFDKGIPKTFTLTSEKYY